MKYRRDKAISWIMLSTELIESWETDAVQQYIRTVAARELRCLAECSNAIPEDNSQPRLNLVRITERNEARFVAQFGAEKVASGYIMLASKYYLVPRLTFIQRWRASLRKLFAKIILSDCSYERGVS